MSNTYSQSDVASHNKTDSLWIVVDGDVYDLTKFQEDHPGMSNYDAVSLVAP
jgi:cytochrome b involved in lipid metabolism